MVWWDLDRTIAGLVRRSGVRGPTGRRRVGIALSTVVALLLAGLVVTWLTDPPSSVAAAEIDGRTWLPVPRSDGAALVLANGISGLVEAEAEVAEALPSGLQFAGSDATYTLLANGATSVVVADGTHLGAVVDTGARSTTVLGGGGLLTTGTDISVRPIAADGAIGPPVVVEGAGTPTAGLAPVVDADGDAWVLTGDDADTALRIDQSGRVADRIQVAPDASGLLVVDGRPYVRHDDEVSGLDGDDRLAAPGTAGIVPIVAQSVEGRWAVADGRRITLQRGGTATTVQAPDDVEALAVWYGSVWAATAGSTLEVRDGQARPVGDVEGPFEVFTDGGRLWFVSADGAIAIDRHQQATVFRLAGVDLSLCVGDCSPEAAVDFLDEQTPTTPPPSGAPATTLPTPDITLPPVVPTTTTTTTTTVPAAPATTNAAPRPSPATTLAPAPTSTVLVATASTAAPAVTASPTTVDTVAPSVPIETSPPPPPSSDPSSPFPLPTRPPPPTRPPVVPDPPDTSTSTTAPPPAPGGGVILAFAGGSDPITGSTATVQIGFDGNADQCVANGGTVVGGSTSGVLTWSGAGSGSRIVTVGVTGGTASETIDVQPGQLAVSFTVCGLSASVGRAVAGAPPSVGDIAVAGSPIVGQQFSASVGYSYGAGWTVGNASWTAGACGSEAAVAGSTGPSSSSVALRATSPGRYCISVVVSFVAGAGPGTQESRSTRVDVGAATTTTSVTTTTTVPTTTSTVLTTTTTVPATDPPTTVAPPTTAAPVTTVAPATTVAPTTTQAPPTTAAPTTTTEPPAPPVSG